MTRRRTVILVAASLLAVMAVPFPARSAPAVRGIEWQQVAPDQEFTLAVERREYTAFDVGGRIVLAMQAGKRKTAKGVSVKWSIRRGGSAVHEGRAQLDQGMAVIDFDVALLAVGDYAVEAEFLDGTTSLAHKTSGFAVLAAPEVATKGRVPLLLPRGVQAGDGMAPLNFGVPFPKGALTDLATLRVVDAKGKPVPAAFSVRGRWGYHAQASVRWLGIDLQSPTAGPWWPDREAVAYHLEFGGLPGPTPQSVVRARQTEQGVRVETGTIAFTVRTNGFNLIDDVVLDGKPVPGGGGGMGPYIVDHEGSVYRAANDRAVRLSIEEHNDLRVVVRAEGWYVKDGTDGSRRSFTLPTDRISRFITRIEACAGQPTVRVQHTWIITYDSFLVRLRDVGMALPAAVTGEAEFGVLGADPVRAAVPKEGVHLIQHRHDRFAVETGAGKALAEGAKSDGSVRVAMDGDRALGVTIRQAWQRFPKELEVLPDQVRLHVWPAHGKTDPTIDPYAKDRYHQLWFAHQGRELNLNFPWETLFTVMKLTDNPATGIYKPGGTAMGGVHASAMGASITSDIQLSFTAGKDMTRARQLADSFNHHAHAIAHPDWLAASRALGPVHPYDPKSFHDVEDGARRILRAYRALQDETEEYGMFLYRAWHHGSHRDGMWEPYRLTSAGHHYEPYMPWLYYARSGDPEHFDHADSTSRQVSDLGVIHHDEPKYPHVEFHSRQRRLVGSMRHTNGFVLWGGDHAVLGHLTCYNGFLVGHYLTGDLRYREILVDEWQRSLMDRTNPELPKASRLGPGRDNNNSMGELIDLYQLTWDPRLLASIEPCIERFLDDMKVWGLPVQNLLVFSGHPEARKRLLESLEARRADKTKDLHGLFQGISPAGMYALGSLEAPGKGFAGESLVHVSNASLSVKAAKLERGDPIAMSTVPDDLLYLPRVMAAVAAERQGGTLGNVVSTQPLPMGGMNVDGNFTRIVAREDKDAPFVVEVKGQIRDPGIPLFVYAPNGKQVLNAAVPEGLGKAYTIPGDGQTGEYAIFLRLRDSRGDVVMSPVTTLPKEVYVMGYWSQPTPTRFFTRLPNGEDGRVEVSAHRTPGTILSADMQTTLASIEKGGPIGAVVPDDGVWLNMKARYLSMPKRGKVVLAVDPERWFAPSPRVLAIQPQP
jgi:hypothetical protein